MRSTSRITHRGMRQIMARHSADRIWAFVETGTYLAENVVNLATLFKQSHSIELSLQLALSRSGS